MINLSKIALTTSVVAASFALGAHLAAARDLTIVGWGGPTQDAQHKVYMKPFADETQKTVLEDSWDGGYGVLQAKVKAGNPAWDVVQVEADELALGCADGIYEKLNWDTLGVKKQFLADSVSPCGAGVYYWSVAIGYDGDKLAKGPASWTDFWDTKTFPGKRSLRKGPKYNLEFALLADGVKPAELYTTLATPEGVDRAFRKLDELRPNIVWWEAGGQPLQFLASGEVSMAAVYNGRLTNINKTEHRNYKLVWPQSIYAVDSWVILKNAENRDLAEKFIAFASRAENQAKFPTMIDYGMPNTEASKKISPATMKDLPTNPENLKDAIPLNVNFWIDNGEDLTARFNAWLAQ